MDSYRLIDDSYITSELFMIHLPTIRSTNRFIGKSDFIVAGQEDNSDHLKSIIEIIDIFLNGSYHWGSSN